MKICTIIGARPQFIKAATLSRALRREHDEILIHTGQHYDYNMSDIFFKELGLPAPDYNLGISSVGSSHGKMTGAMIAAIEDILMKENPGLTLVYGDTNSTLAGALAAAKLSIPVCHVEAGVRAGMRQNPEEINRVLTDHLSTLLMCSTTLAVDYLRAEGIVDNVYMTGDIMYDAVLHYLKQVEQKTSEELIGLDGRKINISGRFYYLTCHRQEHTESDGPLTEIMTAMEDLDAPVVYPVHPRNQDRAKRICKEKQFKNFHLVEPVGYITSLFLCKNALRIVTDSGGLQKEAWLMKTPCVTVFPVADWPETLVGNMNQMASAKASDISQKLKAVPDLTKWSPQFGDGHAAKKITQIISAYKKGE